MDYSFNAEIATKYGVEEAVFIHNLFWWITKNEANDRHFHEGRYWTYNTTKAFADIFPFWSERQIGRIINKLRDCGALYIEHFNSSARDRTRWFSICDEIITIYRNGNLQLTKRSNATYKTVTCNLPNGEMQLTKPSDATYQTVPALPDSKPDITTDSKPDYEAYRQAFIDCCPSLPHPQEVDQWSANRKKSIRAKNVTIEEFRDVCKKIERSDFLSGRNGKWAGCSFDWILKPANWQKILEGNYNRDGGGPPSPRSPSYDIDAYERSSIFDDMEV